MENKEYIERGAFKKRLEDFSKWCKDGRKQGVDFVLDCPLPDMPAADVVEVVRCKDCAVPHNKWTGCPNLNGLIPPPDFYCAKGERRENK